MVQLSVEQQQLDELREVVTRESADIARETEYVTRLAQVRHHQQMQTNT